MRVFEFRLQLFSIVEISSVSVSHGHCAVSWKPIFQLKDLAVSSQVAFVPLQVFFFFQGLLGFSQDTKPVLMNAAAAGERPGSSDADAVVAATGSVPFPVREGQSSWWAASSACDRPQSLCCAVIVPVELASRFLSF
jgi:hypothetical protein